MPENEQFTFVVDINRLIELKLGFEEYFIIHCISTNNEQLILSYVKNCKFIDTSVFKKLEADGYIRIKTTPNGVINFRLLSLAEKSESILCDRAAILDLEKQFGEFRKCYPLSVQAGKQVRRLQGNLKRCKQLYDKLLMETTHEILCKCAELYTQEKYKTNSQMYMQNLETWLHQRNYEQYLEDINKTTTFTDPNTKFTDDI